MGLLRNEFATLDKSGDITNKVSLPISDAVYAQVINACDVFQNQLCIGDYLYPLPNTSYSSGDQGYIDINDSGSLVLVFNQREIFVTPSTLSKYFVKVGSRLSSQEQIDKKIAAINLLSIDNRWKA